MHILFRFYNWIPFCSESVWFVSKCCRNWHQIVGPGHQVIIRGFEASQQHSRLSHNTSHGNAREVSEYICEVLVAFWVSVASSHALPFTHGLAPDKVTATKRERQQHPHSTTAEPPKVHFWAFFSRKRRRIAPEESSNSFCLTIILIKR
jgi:hypothetical protein